jgi:hypothetical protein
LDFFSFSFLFGSEVVIFEWNEQETLSFLSLPENEFIWDNLQLLRYNFCVVVRSIAQEFQGHHNLLEKGFRERLFALLSRWSLGEALLNQEQNKRKLVRPLFFFFFFPTISVHF